MHSQASCTYSGVNAPEKFQHLLENWIKALRNYEEQLAFMGGDYGWIYNERANVGFLSAAAWLAGGVSLEEYKWDKSHPVKEFSKGRSDLYIYLHGQEFHCEAKHYTVELKEGCEKKVQDYLDEAVANANQVICDDKPAYALLFILPYININSPLVDRDWRITLGKISTIQCSAYAWYFPKDKDKRLHLPIAAPKNIFGGVVLLIKETYSSPSK